MAQANKKRPTPPKPNRTPIWIAAVVVVVAVIAVAVYMNSRTGTQPAAPTEVATAPAPVPEATPAPGILKRHIYSETADPQADISSALKQAAHEHKRVIVDFGGDWCGDCQVLDIYFHQQPNVEILDKNFVLVHVWIGHMDEHVDVAEKYGVPLKKGVPALAVLAPTGKVLYAQRSGEFEKMRSMDPASVTEFLQTWKS